MANSIFTAGKFQALTAAGIAPGAFLYTYAAGTTTPLATYTAAGSSNANPVVCDASGQADVDLGSTAYHMVLKTALGVTIWDRDNIISSATVASPTAKDNPWAAAGNNVATDTTAYQAFLDAGVIDVVPVNAAGFKVVGITVPATVKSIKGQRFYQSVVGANTLTATSHTGLKVSNVDFYGVAGSSVASANSGLKLDTCSSVQLDNLYFEGHRFYPLWSKGVTNSTYSNLQGKGNSDGFRFTSCNNIAVSGASLYSPQTTAADFIVGVGIDSTDGGNTVCENLSFSTVNIKGYVNAQGILMHAGKRISVVGGVMDDVSIGVGITQFNAADTLQDITISGLNIQCTTTAGTSNGSYGVTCFGYDSTYMAENLTVQGCTIRGANSVDKSIDRGGIAGQYVKQLTLTGNHISGGFANGYAFYRRVQDLDLMGGSVSDIGTYLTEANGIRFGENSGGWMAATGQVRDVKMRNLVTGIRFSVTSGAACTITRSSTTATVTKTAHGYAVSDWVRITGVTFASAADGYYNGAFQVVSVGSVDTFTYTMAGTPTNAAAPGSPTVQGSYDGLYIDDITYTGVTTQTVNGTYAVLDGVRTYVAGDKSPYVGRTRQMAIANSSAVVITSFRGGALGQELTLTFADGNTTLSNGSVIKTIGGADFVGANLQSIALVCTDATTPVWVPKSQTTAVA